MSTKNYLHVSAMAFAVVALIHLIRAIPGWTFEIGPLHVPLAVSWIAFAVIAALSVWALNSARRQ